MERVLKGRTARYELCGNVLIIVPFKELDHCCAVDVREEADSLIEKSGALPDSYKHLRAHETSLHLEFRHLH